MFKVIRDVANWSAKNSAFFVTVMTILLVAGLAYFKDVDATSTLPALVGLFLGQTATRAVSSHFAASRDPQCDTAKIIREVEGLSPEKQEAPKGEGQ